MARRQVLVQLDDELVALLDQVAGRSRVSRSSLIREATERYLAADSEAAIDAAIAAGYARVPAEDPDAEAMARAVASIEAEPW